MPAGTVSLREYNTCTHGSAPIPRIRIGQGFKRNCYLYLLYSFSASVFSLPSFIPFHLLCPARHCCRSMSPNSFGISYVTIVYLLHYLLSTFTQSTTERARGEVPLGNYIVPVLFLYSVPAMDKWRQLRWSSWIFTVLPHPILHLPNWSSKDGGVHFSLSRITNVI